ncbi:hypothetical protein M422DRAFT_271266 [Sphaerobolus stellatus SS14]|uniref:DNA 3'-5' helicase n=1 Tax=Sphaerobolus stellatus (strain SS14) TaxID=990650 RepID=A0A0C9UQA5_SPHS4|nr:hypothetical protein M422DRAFT_271266 [Sphaerobolus stellatus SS14]
MVAAPSLPTFSQIRDDTHRVFSVRPCISQIQATAAQLEQDSDVVYISGTGSGKTLTFWMPMLYEEGSITILVTALNILGKQTADLLNEAGIPAINLTAANANRETFKEIKDCKYRLIVVGPELLVEHPAFDDLWITRKFVNRLTRVIFDEGHCISQWSGSFRPEYGFMYTLRFVIPKAVQFYVVSATLPDDVLSDVWTKLRLQKNTHIIRRTNDRWNCDLTVRRMQHPIKSFKDLDFLIPKGWKPGQQLPSKFLVFFNSRKEAEAACAYLWKKHGIQLKKNLVWFHSVMTEVFRADTMESFAAGQDIEEGLWGLMCTDAAGMGLDIPDITLIVQWRVPGSLCTLMQRFGRGARNLMLHATCILLAEPSYFTDYKEKAAERKKIREERAAKSASSRSQSDVGPSYNCGQSSRGRGRTRGGFVRPKQREEREMEQSMDDFINADRLILKCRRTVCNLYFGNNLVVGEAFCCQRCFPRTPPLCCDLCNPELMEIFNIKEPDMVDQEDKEVGEEDEEMEAEGEVNEQDQEGTTRRRKVGSYIESKEDKELRKELWKWRAGVFNKRWPLGDPLCMGETLVLPDCILDRIVDLGHAKLITKEEDICSQTRWVDPWKYSKDIFEIIQCVNPPVPKLFTSTPREIPRGGNNGNSGFGSGEGHNKRTCSKRASVDKENVPPPSLQSAHSGISQKNNNVASLPVTPGPATPILHTVPHGVLGDVTPLSQLAKSKVKPEGTNVFKGWTRPSVPTMRTGPIGPISNSPLHNIRYSPYPIHPQTFTPPPCRPPTFPSPHFNPTTAQAYTPTPGHSHSYPQFIPSNPPHTPLSFHASDAGDLLENQPQTPMPNPSVAYTQYRLFTNVAPPSLSHFPSLPQ